MSGNISKNKFPRNFASKGLGVTPAVPFPGKNTIESVTFSTSGVVSNSHTVSATYKVSNPVDVWEWRRVHVFMRVANAATGNIVSVVPEISIDNGFSEALWFPIGVSDGTFDTATLDSSVSSTFGPNNFNTMTMRPLSIRTPAASSTESIQLMFTLDVTSAKHIRFKVGQIDAGTAPTITLRVGKSQ